MNANALGLPAPDGRRGGFILPVALVALVLLTMVSSAGLYSARNDFRAARAVHHAAVALAAADAGASRTMATWAQSVPVLPVAGDSIVIDWQALPDGSEYRSVVYRSPVGGGGSAPSRVMVHTTGRVRPPGMARRTVVTILDVVAGGALCCEAAFKVQRRLRVENRDPSDPVPELDGTDRNPPGWGGFCPSPLTDVPGVVTSDQTGIVERRFGDIAGGPPIVEDPTITATDFADFGVATFADLVSQADLTFGPLRLRRNVVQPVVGGGLCDTAAPFNWGSPGNPGGPCGSYAPVIHVSGNLQIQSGIEGQGVLLVDGNLNVTGDFDFYGLVIVQGRLRIRGPGSIYGAAIVRGGVAGNRQSEISRGGKVSYSSCAVTRAQAGLTLSSGAARAAGRSWFEVIG